MKKKAHSALFTTHLFNAIACILFLCLIASTSLVNASVDYKTYESMAPVRPYFHPNNDQVVNLILVGDRLNEGNYFKDSVLELNSVVDFYKSKQETTDGQDAPSGEVSPKQISPSSLIEGIPSAIFFYPSHYIEAKQAQDKKTLMELDQFGVDANARTIASLNELKRFNQTVVQDSQIDNLQKQLLISLRGALFSYHFTAKESDKTTKTTNDIITNKINALSGDERVLEYKSYLLALDAYKNNQLQEAKEAFMTLIDAKHTWIAESASYMLIEIGIEEFNQWFQAHGSEFSVDKTAKNGTENSDKNALIEEKSQKIQSIEKLVNAYQKRYPTGNYLIEVKSQLFSLLKVETDPLRKIRLYQMEAAFYEDLLNTPLEYEDAMNVMPLIKNDVLVNYPFALNNPVEKLTKEKAYVIQPVHPLLDFIDLLSKLGNVKKSGLTLKALEQRANQVALSLDDVNLTGLANYLRIEAHWRIYKNADKTLKEIEALALSFDDIYQEDIFSIFMVKIEALTQLNQLDEVQKLVDSIVVKNKNQAGFLTDYQRVYLEMRQAKIAKE